MLRINKANNSENHSKNYLQPRDISLAQENRFIETYKYGNEKNGYQL